MNQAHDKKKGDCKVVGGHHLGVGFGVDSNGDFKSHSDTKANTDGTQMVNLAPKFNRAIKVIKIMQQDPVNYHEPHSQAVEILNHKANESALRYWLPG
tara:strand:+ start:1023 stop:1316 length:294 start_codon:yes stop_codon:yes gene_type:complete